MLRDGYNGIPAFPSDDAPPCSFPPCSLSVVSCHIPIDESRLPPDVGCTPYKQQQPQRPNGMPVVHAIAAPYQNVAIRQTSRIRLFGQQCRCRLVVSLVVACLVLSNSSLADKPSSPSRINPSEFLERYCIECHLADDPSGEREFESLDLAKSDLDTQRSVQEIIDQLTLSTMPPEEGDQPSTQERLATIDAFTHRLTKMRQQTASTGGRTVLRRLSKREYRRTIGDLLCIDMTMFDPTIEFPSDNLSGHFDNIGDALVTSGHLLERYLEAAERSVDKALAVTIQPEPQQWIFKDSFYQQPEVARGHKVAFNNQHLCLYDHPYADKPEGAYGHIARFESGVPVDGIYEIRVLAKAMNRDTPYSNQAVRIDLDEPFRMGVRPGDTSIGDMVHTQPIQPLLAETLVSGDEYKWYTFRVPLDQGFAPRFTFENGIHDFRGSIGRVFRLHKNTLPKKAQNKKGIFEQRIALIQHGRMPHIRIDEIEIRGPVDYSWPTTSQQVLLGETGLVGEIVQAESKIAPLLEEFASRAFRRPATKQEVQGFLGLFQSRRKDGRDVRQAYQDTLKAVLCSPSFLYFKQRDSGTQSNLSGHALAERLAYFLTSTMPDERLRELADRGQISDPETLRREVQRLLESEASDAFVTDFLDSWLNLRSLGNDATRPE